MCRLFGIIANKSVDIEFSFFNADTPFKKLSEDNKDGWGIGWYKLDKPEIYKQGIEDVVEYNFDKVKTIKSNIIISHVRWATTGNKSSINAHPFQYKNWIFAHNGKVDRDFLLDKLNNKYRVLLKGETDSEVYFLIVMQFLEESQDIIKAIRETIKLVKNSNYTGLNFLLTDGKNFYAFRDGYSLFYLRRSSSENKSFEYPSEETGEKIIYRKPIGETAVLFSSEKLTKEKENWKSINSGEIIIVNENLNLRVESV